MSEAVKGNETANGEQQFAIQRLYVKDLSFEAPGVPKVFQQEWKPEMHLDINTSSSLEQDDLYEVVLRLTVTVKSNNANAFVVEVKYAGLFTIKGFNPEQLKHTLSSFCPNVLYPYARAEITDIVSRASFPQLILSPINFEALYQQHLQEQAKKGETGDAAQGDGGQSVAGSVQ